MTTETAATQPAMTLVRATPAYAIRTQFNGLLCEITNHRMSMSVLLQGDEAGEFLDTLEEIISRPDTMIEEVQAVERACAEYDLVMAPTA